MVNYTVFIYEGLQLKSQHWNLNGGSMTALLPVLLPTSILLRCFIILLSFSQYFNNIIISFFFFFLSFFLP